MLCAAVLLLTESEIPEEKKDAARQSEIAM
jgi:hypothetical protein